MSDRPELFPTGTNAAKAKKPKAATAAPAGHVRKRTTRRDRAMTSFELSTQQRQVLGEIAQRRGMSIAAVLREGLALVAAKEGLAMAAVSEDLLLLAAARDEEIRTVVSDLAVVAGQDAQARSLLEGLTLIGAAGKEARAA